MAVLALLVGALVVSVSVTAQEYYPCIQRAVDAGNVCVCNATYCDTVPPLQDLQPGEYQLYSTSNKKSGFTSTKGQLNGVLGASGASVKIESLDETFQTILGFGGAFTDATGIDVQIVSAAAQQNILLSYFGQEGIEYSVCRVPVAGVDFSTRGYTYCDEQDETLDKFALEPEDFEYKIPLIQRAYGLRGKENLKLFASAWSAPLWMKTNATYGGYTTLKDEYYPLWAKYYVKFFDAYKKNGIDFWGMTTQNEPSNGILGGFVPNLGFTEETMKIWIRDHLGPAIRNSSFKDIKIMAHDDQRTTIPALAEKILSDKDTVEYLDGVAMHFYADAAAPVSNLDLITSPHKELFRFASEACNGFYHITPTEAVVSPGNWTRADRYLTSIIEDMSHDFISWVDWNLVLDEEGQPNYVEAGADAPIIVSGQDDEFYKQPTFYALGHFSKFVVPGSIRVASTWEGDGLDGVAFVRPDEKIAIVIRNRLDTEQVVSVSVLENSADFTIEANSVNTILVAV